MYLLPFERDTVNHISTPLATCPCQQRRVATVNYSMFFIHTDGVCGWIVVINGRQNFGGDLENANYV